MATETGLLHRLRKEAPDKTLLAADEGAVCRYMKQITLPKLRATLRDPHSQSKGVFKRHLLIIAVL